jgi:AraC family transcriptional regulator
MSFEVTVVDFPAKHLIGMKVRTDMQKAQTDCSTLWQTFGPIEIPGYDCTGGAYGIYIMLNENDFDYWAAVETSSSVAVPDGMQSVALPAGPYAKCTAASLEKLGEVYMYLYGEWITQQQEFTPNVQAPSFELYPSNWQMNGAFDVYVPVNKK